MRNLRRFLSLLLATAMLLAMRVTALAADFDDVSPDADYAGAVDWCSENDLMGGVSATSFDPDGTLTRAMAATILYRAAGEPAVTGVPAFADAQADTWYSDALVWASGAGIMGGYGGGVFGTNDPVTREQLNVLVRRYAGESPAWTGDPALNVSATRAEAAVAFYTYLREEPGNEAAPAPDTGTAGGKVLVAYFSASGNTEAVAKAISDTLDADLFELVPATPYTSDDLNWTVDGSRVNREHEDESLRNVPLAQDTVDNWDEYETVFIGYPIWWGIAAWPVDGFVQSNDFTGKAVIPFCTSASSGLGQSGTLLAEMAGTGDWQEGRRFTGRASQSDVEAWVNGLELPKAPATQPAQ